MQKIQKQVDEWVRIEKRETASLETVLDFLVDSTPEEKLPKVDAVFVFGHIDPRVASHAARLFKLGKADRIILTGKGRKAIPGFENEADYYASIVEKKSVLRSSLILEKKSTNTLQNVLFGMQACGKRGLRPESLILVAMSPLLRRSRATFEKQYPNISIYCSGPNIPTEEYAKHIERILEEFDRLDEYSKKGDIVPVDIPQAVKEAIQDLKSKT